MTTELSYEDEKAWKEMRHCDITSTDVAGLFGLSPYRTAFELYHEKKEENPPEFDQTDRMVWGSRMEQVIAEGFASDHGLIVKPMKNYYRHETVKRMGSSYDYKIVGIKAGAEMNDYIVCFMDNGPGILEIKKVDYFIYKEQWVEDEAPVHIEIQVQQQMEVANMNWCAVVPLVGGNEIKPFIRERDRDFGRKLCKRVTLFWENNFDKDIAPNPDYAKDAETIARLYNKDDGEPMDAMKNNRLPTLCAEYKAGAAKQKDGEEEKKIAKGEILMLIGNAPKAFTNGFNVSASVTKSTPPTIITKEMVGTSIGGRKGSRSLRITENQAGAK